MPGRMFRPPVLLTLLTLGWLLLTAPHQNRAPAIAAEETHAAALTTVMLELESEPALAIYTALSASQVTRAAQVDATQAHIAALNAQQQQVTAKLPAFEAQAIYALQRVYNGIVVRAPASQVEALAALAGVRAVHPMTPKRPTHLDSVPFIGAPQLWDPAAGAGVTGAGVTIAVIDTGVDYLHADFGGSRDYIHNDPVIVGDVAGFPSAKIIGGYDFAGDEYNADRESDSYNPIPAPDGDPYDCFGHGTHVAGTAAGYGVTLEHETYFGPYSADTPSAPFAIAPGVAPEARIYALKVFGCRGSSDLTELAIEWSVDPNGDGDFSDHVDVINMSLGAAYGSIYDPSVIASRNAAQLGIIVVASAGNDGDTFFGVSAPAVAEASISVASSGRHRDALTTPVGTIPLLDASGFSSRGPRRHDLLLKPDISAPGESISSAGGGSPGWNALTFSGTSMAAPHVAGALALLRQIYPSRRVQELKALIMNTSRMQLSREREPVSPTRTGAGLIDLVHALRSPAIAFSVENPNAVSISFGAPSVSDTRHELRSLRIKNRSDQAVAYLATYAPLLDTPGVDFSLEENAITAPAFGQAELAIRLTANAAEMRNSADPRLAQSQIEPRHWLAEEAGHVILWPADARFGVPLATFPDRTPVASVEALFHYEPLAQTLHYTVSHSLTTPLPRTDVAIRRGLATEAESELAYPLASARTIAAGSVLTGAIELLPGDEQLLASRALLFEIDSPGLPDGQLRGQLEPTRAVLHVPVYAAPRLVSSMQAQSPQLTFTVEGPPLRLLNLRGSGFNGAPPDEPISLLSAFELHYSSADQYIGAPGQARADITDHADLKYVGVASDYFGVDRDIGQTNVRFGIATYGEWSTPNEVEFSIYIDVNEDGVDDFRVFNSDARRYDSRYDISDAFAVVVENLRSQSYAELQPLNGRWPDEIPNAPYNTNVMLLSVRAADLGLDAKNVGFNYYVVAMSQEQRNNVEVTPTLRFVLPSASLDFGSQGMDGPLMRDVHGAQIGVTLRRLNFVRSGIRSVLLLHHHNETGARAEVIDVEYLWPQQVYLPWAPSR